MSANRSRLWGERGPRYLAAEAALLLGWSYIILAGGGITAQINFRVQAISAALAAVVLGGWLVLRLARGRRIPYSGFDVGAALFLGALVLSTFYSADPRRSLAALALYLVWAMVFYFWWDVLRAGAPAELPEKTLLIAGAILLGLGLVDVAGSLRVWRDATWGGRLPFAPPFHFRLYTLLGDANLSAAAISLTIPPALMRGLRAGRGARLGWWAYAALGYVFLFFTSSRGGWLGAAAALGVLLLLLARDTLRAGAAAPAQLRWLARLPQVWARLRGRPIALGVLAAVVLAGALGAGLLLTRQAGGPTHGPALSARNTFWLAAWRAFLADPLTGEGPGLFTTVYTRYAGVPPDRPYQHAHSFPFTLLAEGGLNGVVGLLVLLAALARALRHAREPLPAGPPAGRLAHPPPLSDVAGPLAALCGLAVHSLFDNHLLFGAVGIPAAFLLASALHGAATVSPRALPARAAARPAGLSPWLFLGIGLPLAGLALYSFRAQAVFERGLDAAREGDWGGAAALFDEAWRRDPAFAFYPLQAGFAYGTLAADGDAAALGAAIARYEAGVAREPNYSLNHASLGALYLQAGRPAEAQEALRRAIDLAPGAWLYWLNYGLAAEAEGRPASAQEAYLQALARRPALAAARFWEANPVRQAALAAFQAPAPSEADPLAQGRALLESGDAAGAQAAFEAAWRADPLRPAVYEGLAAAAEARGDLPLAHAYFHAGLSVQTIENESKVLPLLAWAELSAQTGEHDRARGLYETAYQAVAQATAYGWGGYGFSPYGWFGFARDSLPADLLPQLARADVPPDLAARFLPLGALREAEGDVKGAAALYRRLLDFDPDLAEARARLDALDAAAGG